MKNEVEPINEKLLCAVLAIMAIGVGNKFVGLGRKHSANNIRMDILKTATQPHIKIVRKIGIADIIIIWRIARNYEAIVILLRSADLVGKSIRNGRCMTKHLRNPFNLP